MLIVVTDLLPYAGARMSQVCKMINNALKLRDKYVTPNPPSRGSLDVVRCCFTRPLCGGLTGRRWRGACACAFVCVCVFAVLADILEANKTFRVAPAYQVPRVNRVRNRPPCPPLASRPASLVTHARGGRIVQDVVRSAHSYEMDCGVMRVFAPRCAASCPEHSQGPVTIGRWWWRR